MTAGDLIADDWQIEIRGLLLGPGTVFRVGGLDGLTGRRVRRNDQIRAGQHGVDPGLDLIDAGTVALAVNAGRGHGQDPAELVGLLDTLHAAWAPGDTIPLAYQLPTLGKRVRYGRCRDVDVDISQLAVGYITALLEFTAADPLVYGFDQRTATTGAPVAGPGFTVPFTLPVTITAAAAVSATVVNAGTTVAPWTARIDGPCSSPGISHVEQGAALELPGLVLTAGQWVDVDSAARTILLGGTASRRSYLTTTSRWFGLDAGSNTIRFSTFGTTGTLTVAWRDTWPG